MSAIKKLIFGVVAVAGLWFGATAVIAATPDCPDCPADLDGSIFPGGSCKNCKDPNDYDGSIFPGGSCENCSATRKSNAKVRIVDGPAQRACPSCSFKTRNYPLAKARYKTGDLSGRNCCDMAPFALTHVDFKLDGQGVSPYASHVGNYRFRIFGCRRQDKKALLNHGRVIQKNMAFQDVFRKAADKCYKVMDIPGDVCLSDPNVKLPEYVLTAEINNFFMNVCDEYDWARAQKNNKRSGSSEMTVTWRLMNLSQTKVFWKGVTTGYAELEDGIFEGEIALAEAAFADAAARLSSLPGFENQLKVRVSPEELAQERAALVAFDAKFNPAKCGLKQEIAYTRSCAYAPQPQCPAIPRPVCPCAVQQPCVCNQPVCACPMMTCPCAQPAKPKVEEFVDVKTLTQTIEKKIITTTRVETPQPVCQQVCRPVCPEVKKKVTTKTVTTTVEENTVVEPECPMMCGQQCEKPKCRKICTKTCIEGTEECTEECREDCSDEPLPAPVVEENSGVEVKNVTVKDVVEEDGGVTDSHRIYENCIDDMGNVISDGSCTLIDDSWVDLDGFAVDAKLCVADRPAYEELSPENMLKIRGSVVELTNAKGVKGTGLLVSEDFVLTSAGLVNKLQNSYDVKLLNGEVVKGRAVRVNPSKNTALVYLDKKVNYQPLALNLELPAIDQEGFISLGVLGAGETEKNYLDDSGKIYGYRYSENLGTEIIVDTLVQKVYPGSVLVDKLGTVNGISNSAKQTEDGMDLFMPTETALRSIGLSICEKTYEKKSPWQKTVYKPITEKVQQEAMVPEALPASKRK